MTPIHHLQPAVFRCHLIHCSEDGEMLDVFYVRVRVGVDVRVEPSYRYSR